MADNVNFQSGTLASPSAGLNVATKEVAHAGDTTDVQMIHIVSVTGSEGSHTLNEISDANGIQIQGTAADGAAVAGNPVLIAGFDGTNTQTLVTDTSGRLAALLAANDGVDIGDVDVTSVVPGTAATSLGKAVDAAAGGTDTGVVLLAVRDDALTTLTPADGDYTQLRVSSTGALHVDGSAATQPVSAASLPLPSGAATAANQSTANTSLSNIETAVQLIDNAISGTEMQVDVVASLPAGTNAIGKLAANDGVDIGDVDVTSVVPGTAATSLGKAVDAVAGGTDTGVVLLAVRDDSLTTLTPADGDYTQLRVSSTGALHVTGGGGGTEYNEDDAAAANPAGGAVLLVRQDTPAALVSADGDMVAQRATDYGAAYVQILDSSGNFINSFGGSGGTAMNDDSAFTPGTSQVTPAGFLADETTPDSVDEGDIGAPRMSLNRIAYSIIRDAAGNERGVNVNASNELAVNVGNTSLAVTSASALDVSGATVTVDSELPAAAALADNASNPTAPAVGAFAMVWDGATWDRAPGTSADGLTVNLGSNNDVTVTGTVTVDSELPAAAALATGMSNPTAPAVGAFNMVYNGATWDRLRGNTTGIQVQGGTAHDAVDAGNPVKIGGKAYETDGTAPGTAVAEADRVQFIADRYGRQFVATGHPNGWKANENHTTAQTNNELKAAPGASTSLYITGIIISCSDAGTVKIVSNTASPTDELGPYYFAANGGLVAMDVSPPVRIAANTNVGFTSTSVTNHTVTLIGYTAP